MIASQILAKVKRIAREHYAWPGGYELYAVCDDGGTLCFGCCKKEFPLIARATITKDRSGWQCVGYGCTSDAEETFNCDHCGRVIFEADEGEA
jgi:hypothetical protein